MADILDLLLNGDPMAQQKRQADALRGKQQFQDMVSGANEQGQSLNLLNFVAQNSNNPILGKSVAALAASQQAQNAPQKLDKGVYIPSTGAYQESPGVAEEKDADREQKRLQAASIMASRDQAAQSAADARRYAADQAREGRVLSATLAQQTRGMMTAAQIQAAADRKARMDQQAVDNQDKQVTKLSTALEKGGVPEFETALNTAETRLAAHKPGELPGYGRIMGGVPSFALPAEAQMARADMSQAANVLLKARSGAAVTDSEQRRFLQEVATGGGMSEEAMRHGWENIRKTFESKKTGILAGWDDATVNTYNERAAVPLLRRKTDKPAATNPDDELINKWLPKTN